MCPSNVLIFSWFKFTFLIFSPLWSRCQFITSGTNLPATTGALWHHRESCRMLGEVAIRTKRWNSTFSQVAKAKNTERMISRRNNKRLVLKNRLPRFDVASCHEEATHLQNKLQRCWGGWQIKNHRFAWPLGHPVITVHCSVQNKSQCYWEGKQILLGHLDPKISECWDRVCEQMPLPDSQMTTER